MRKVSHFLIRLALKSSLRSLQQAYSKLGVTLIYGSDWTIQFHSKKTRPFVTPTKKEKVYIKKR